MILLIIIIYYWILVRSPRAAVDLSSAVGVLRQWCIIYYFINIITRIHDLASHVHCTHIIIHVTLTRELDANTINIIIIIKHIIIIIIIIIVGIYDNRLK